MAIQISTALAIYFVIWWIALFLTLPFGVRSQHEDGVVVPGTPESAPTAPRLLRIVGLTTLISCVVFAVPWALAHYGIFDVGTLIGRTR